MNITFCIIGESCSRADGQYLLAILKVPEKYESMKSALPELISKICETKSVVVADTEYTLEFFLGGYNVSITTFKQPKYYVLS